MADIRRRGTATWQGDPKTGSGEFSAASGEFSGVGYSFPSRFEQGEGSNPEELIASAHAGCFNMIIALEVARRDVTLENLETEATVTLANNGGEYEITEVHLDTTATVPAIDDETFREIAETARDTCPVSNLLKPGLQKVTLEARLA